jgi:hypothetical protein
MLQVGDVVGSTIDYLLDYRGEVKGFGECPDSNCNDPICAVLVDWTAPDGKKFSLRHGQDNLYRVNAMLYIAERAR